MHRKEQVAQYLQMAKELNLIPTGGSDYHGPGSGHEALGEINVPEKTLDNLLDRKKQLFG